MCHVLFLVPVVSLPLYWIFPWETATALYVLINGPLLVVGWLAWRLQMRQPVSGREGMIGKTATALTDLAPDGTVLFRNERWRAHAEGRVAAGEPVRVSRVENMELTVQPVGEAPALPSRRDPA